MTKYDASKVSELVNAVGIHNPNPHAHGPVVVEVNLWDGRVVRGSYYSGSKYLNPDAQTIRESFRADDDPRLQELSERLLESGENFVTQTGSHDDLCTLEWTIASE